MCAPSVGNPRRHRRHVGAIRDDEDRSTCKSVPHQQLIVLGCISTKGITLKLAKTIYSGYLLAIGLISQTQEISALLKTI